MALFFSIRFGKVSLCRLVPATCNVPVTEYAIKRVCSYVFSYYSHTLYILLSYSTHISFHTIQCNNIPYSRLPYTLFFIPYTLYLIPYTLHNSGKTYVCSCSTGYQGSDCSLRTCPTAPAW